MIGMASLADTTIGVLVFGGMTVLVVILVITNKLPEKPHKVKQHPYKQHADDTSDPRELCPERGKQPERFKFFGPYQRFTYRYPASVGEEVSSTPVVSCSGCGYFAVAAEMPANNPLGVIVTHGSGLPVHP